jgi:hypothetical protein
MEVVEGASSEGILWQDAGWLGEEASLKRKIDNLGKNQSKKTSKMDRAKGGTREMGKA